MTPSPIRRMLLPSSASVPACEDMCCRDWAIPVDRATYASYRLFPLEKLGAVVAAYLSVPDATAPDAVFARINPTPSGTCPFYAADRLCNIQREHGAALLSATCSSYPRALNLVGDRLEGSLMLSCPQAARDVLLDPGALTVAADLRSGAFRTDNYFTLAQNAPGVLYKPYEDFAGIRGWIKAILTDRARPLVASASAAGARFARSSQASRRSRQARSCRRCLRTIATSSAPPGVRRRWRPRHASQA